MKTARVLLFGLGLAIAAVACAGGTSSNPGTAGTNGAAGTTPITCSSSNQTVCSGQCVDTSSDMNNCGSCGIPCAAGRTCQSGLCNGPPGLLECNGSCVASDAMHCGTCTMMCSGNQVCNNGSCTGNCGSQTPCGTGCCSATQQCTNGACVDITGMAG